MCKKYSSVNYYYAPIQIEKKKLTTYQLFLKFKLTERYGESFENILKGCTINDVGKH